MEVQETIVAFVFWGAASPWFHLILRGPRIRLPGYPRLQGCRWFSSGQLSAPSPATGIGSKGDHVPKQGQSIIVAGIGLQPMKTVREGSSFCWDCWADSSWILCRAGPKGRVLGQGSWNAAGCPAQPWEPEPPWIWPELPRLPLPSPGPDPMPQSHVSLTHGGNLLGKGEKNDNIPRVNRVKTQKETELQGHCGNF